MGFQILVCKSLVVSSYCWKLRHNGYGRINTEVLGSNYKRRRGRHIDNHGENEDEMRKRSANCLVGKVMLTQSINKEGLKAAMQQAWKRVKEVKIESIGDNIFLFKFATEEEKKRVFMGGGGGVAF